MLNASLNVYTTIITKALAGAMPLAHLSHPNILAILKRELGHDGTRQRIATVHSRKPIAYPLVLPAVITVIP